MYVPTTPVVPAVSIARDALLSLTPPTIAEPERTEVEIGAERLDVLVGQEATVRGELEPALAGRVVTLQVHGRSNCQMLWMTA
jgi:hypothetical protein